MTPKEKAEKLLHKYRMLFMNEGKDYGEEILVSILAKQCALIALDEMINNAGFMYVKYWQEVKQEINNL